MDKIQGLDCGADDYLTKPFGVMELVSCVKAVLRRCQPKRESHALSCGGLVLDPDAHTVTADGQRVVLTYKEYELLRLFLSNPGIAFTRDQLIGSGVGHGLRRGNPHGGYAHSDAQAEAGRLWAAD